jgi:hypothetical protein
MENDQVNDEVVEDNQDQQGQDNQGDQSSEEQSEETDEPKKDGTDDKGKSKPKSSGLSQLVKGLQKGYTLTRQEIGEIKGMIEELKNNPQSSEPSDDQDEYITVSKLKEILSQHTQNQANQQMAEREKADKYISDAITDLKAEGVIKSKEDEDSLLNYALEIKEPNLRKAIVSWQRIKEAEAKGTRKAAKTKARQEEGSRIGTSQKTGQPSEGVDYNEIHNKDFEDF